VVDGPAHIGGGKALSSQLVDSSSAFETSGPSWSFESLVVAEAAGVDAVPHVDRAAVRVTGRITLSEVQAVHVDDPAAVPDVTLAADAVIEVSP